MCLIHTHTHIFDSLHLDIINVFRLQDPSVSSRPPIMFNIEYWALALRATPHHQSHTRAQIHTHTLIHTHAHMHTSNKTKGHSSGNLRKTFLNQDSLTLEIVILRPHKFLTYVLLLYVDELSLKNTVKFKMWSLNNPSDRIQFTQVNGAIPYDKG